MPLCSDVQKGMFSVKTFLFNESLFRCLRIAEVVTEIDKQFVGISVGKLLTTHSGNEAIQDRTNSDFSHHNLCFLGFSVC